MSILKKISINHSRLNLHNNFRYIRKSSTITSFSSSKMSPSRHIGNFHLNNFLQSTLTKRPCGEYIKNFFFFFTRKIHCTNFSKEICGFPLFIALSMEIDLLLRARQLKASIMNYLLLAYSK